MLKTQLVCSDCGNDHFEVYESTHGGYIFDCAGCGKNGAVPEEATADA